MRTILAVIFAATLSVACGAGERPRDLVEVDVDGAKSACSTPICRFSRSSGDPPIYVGVVLEDLGIPSFTYRSLGTLCTVCVRCTDRTRAIKALRADPRTRDVGILECPPAPSTTAPTDAR